jgi:hypothetical protein
MYHQKGGIHTFLDIAKTIRIQYSRRVGVRVRVILLLLLVTYSRLDMQPSIRAHQAEGRAGKMGNLDLRLREVLVTIYSQ